MRPRIARFLVAGPLPHILKSFINRPTNCRSPPRFILELLAVAVANDKAGFQFVD